MTPPPEPPADEAGNDGFVWSNLDDEHQFDDCGMGRADGTYFCGYVGSEQCDECEFNIQIGRKRWYTPRVKQP